MGRNRVDATIMLLGAAACAGDVGKPMPGAIRASHEDDPELAPK